MTNRNYFVDNKVSLVQTVNLRKLLLGANKKGKNPTKTEIVGDGEEIEVEAGEDLSENELNLIYKKYVRFDSIVCCRYDLCTYQELNRTINRWEKWNLRILSHFLYDRTKSKHYCE